MGENRLMADLYEENQRLKARIKELEEKHFSECGQIAHYSDENAKLKELLRKAVEVINREISSFTTCEECNMYDEETTECNGNAMDKCSEIGKWRYTDEALALIGEDTNVPASKDDTNVGHKSGDWISCKDRMPEAVEEDVNGKIAFSKSVLVYLVYDNGFTYITNDRFRVDSKSWLHEIPGEGCKVTHWQPLPEPPKDGEQNGW
jgi:hypothetical protein